MATQAQIDVAFKALKQLEAKTVPGWEQSFISDQLLTDVATVTLDNAERAKMHGNDPAKAAFAALQVYRATKVPFYEMSAVTDDVLHGIVAAVLDAVKI